MTLSNWLELALMAVILAAGLSLLLYFHHKFRVMDGFEGIVTEHSRQQRRAFPDREDELKHLEELSKKQQVNK